MSTYPSTLSDVIVTVVSYMTTAGDARSDANLDGVDLLIGERHLAPVNAPPRVVFVQTKDGGKMGPVLEISSRQIASIEETCVAYIWGAETVADGDRYDSAKALAMRVINAFKAAGASRITGARLVRGDASEQTFGEEYQLGISYVWAVPRDEAIFAAAAAGPASTSPTDPDRPNGGTGKTFHVNVVSQPERP